MSLQEALRRMRLELGLTQKDLAHKLNRAFLTVNRWENGKGFPSRDNAKNILEIAHAGNVSEECYDYLSEILKPDIKRSRSAASFGFPDIDRDFLFQLADDSNNSLYVIDAKTYNLLYANKQAEKSAAKHLTDIGVAVHERHIMSQTDKRCFHYFAGRTSPCPFCPLKEFKRNRGTDKVVTIPSTGRIVHIHSKLHKLKERQVYAIYLTDITESNAEIQALYQLTNDIPDGVGIYNVYRDNRIELLFMNDIFFRMIGEERRKAVVKGGGSDLCLVHTNDRDKLRKEIRNSLTGNRAVDIDLHMRMSDEQYHLFHINGKLIKKDVEKNTFYCLFTDLDEPKAIKL